MTRINLVHPSTLADQHLMAEFREIKHIPAFALQRLAAGNLYEELRTKVPASFTLNTGHKWFFVDKMKFLCNRFWSLRDELEARDFTITKASIGGWWSLVDKLPVWVFNDYDVTQEALQESVERITLRLSEKLGWYRWCGDVKETEFFVEMMKGEEVGILRC